jgi:integrase
MRVPPKSEKSRRTLALPPFVVTTLRAHRTRQLEERLVAGPAWQDYDLLFPATTGDPMNPTAVNVLFRRRLQRINATAERDGREPLPLIRFHGLRHSAATMLLAQGLTLGEIQKVLGHAGIQLTCDLYAHFAPEIAQRAADRMESIFAAG